MAKMEHRAFKLTGGDDDGVQNKMPGFAFGITNRRAVVRRSTFAAAGGRLWGGARPTTLNRLRSSSSKLI